MKNDRIFLFSATFNVIRIKPALSTTPSHHPPSLHAVWKIFITCEAGAPCLLLISTAGQWLNLLNFISGAIHFSFLPPPVRCLCSFFQSALIASLHREAAKYNKGTVTLVTEDINELLERENIYAGPLDCSFSFFFAPQQLHERFPLKSLFCPSPSLLVLIGLIVFF